MGYSLKWDLEGIFPGGSQSEKLAAKIKDIKDQLIVYKEEVKGWDVPKTSVQVDSLQSVLAKTEKLEKAVSHVVAFLECATAQDVHDTKADQLNGEIYSIISEFETAVTSFTLPLHRVPCNWLDENRLDGSVYQQIAALFQTRLFPIS